MKKVLGASLAIGAGVLLAGQSFGFVSPDHKPAISFEKGVALPIGDRVIRPNVTEVAPEGAKKFSSIAAKVRYDALSGEARVISGRALAGVQKSTNIDLNTLEKQALEFASGQLGIDRSSLELDKSSTLISKDDQILKFRVSRNGLKIKDAAVSFHFKFGGLIQVINNSFSEASFQDSNIEEANIEAIIRSELDAFAVKAQGEFLRVQASDKGYELVKVKEFRVSDGEDENFVQARSDDGSFFEIKPTKHYMDGSAEGHIHNRWYEEELQLAPYGELKLDYAGGTVTTDVDGNFTGAPDGSEPALMKFEGPRVRVSLTSGTQVEQTGVFLRDGWRVIYRKTDDTPAAEDKNIAQSMIFYHTNYIIQEAKRFVDHNWFDARLTANANLTRTCNAHWDGSTINFYSAGGGCGNTGLISDVVYHEWGHGLDHNVGGIEDGAFSEGFGDIMSLINTKSNILGIGFRIGGAPVRDLEPNKVYPDDRGGGVHSEGLIIGSTFYDLWKGLLEAHGEEAAQELLKKYAFKMIFPASRYTEVYDALVAIDDDNGDLLDGTPNYCIINKNFADHGLATEDQACTLATIDEFNFDDAAGNANGYIDPGETVDLWMLARNSSPAALNGLAGVVSVNGNDAVTVSDANLAWSEIASGSAALSSDAATFEIGADAVCGSTFDVTVRLAADDRNAISSTKVSIGRLDGEVEMNAADGLPQPINDNQTTSASVAFDSDQWEGTTTVQEARLKFDVTHTYVGDLTVHLVNPAGVRTQVFRGSGSGDDVHFDQDVTELIGGQAGGGTWTLEVTDSANQDTGTLDAFTLTLTPAKYVCE